MYCGDGVFVSRPSVNAPEPAREVQAIKIPKPPKQLQLKFADVVRRVNLEKDRHQTSHAQLDALFASQQSRAFAGEL